MGEGVDDVYAYKFQENNSSLIPDSSFTFLPEKKLASDMVTDRWGNIWVTSDNYLSFVISFMSDHILHHSMPALEKTLGYLPSPYKMAEDSGAFWIWQRPARLYYYQSGTDSLLFVDNRKLSSFFEKAVDRKGILAVMDERTVLQIREENGRISESEVVSIRLHPHERIRAIHAGNADDLWIGTSFRLLHYHLKKNELEEIWENTGFVNDIASASGGSVYLVTESNGLLGLSPDGKKVSFSTDENYLKVTVTPDQKVWVGTQQGSIYCYDPFADNFISRTQECRSDGDIILDMEADEQGNVWILTEQKVTIYNPEDQSSYVIRSSDPSVSTANFLSMCKSEDGKMYIGGTGGFFYCPAFSLSGNTETHVPVSLTAVKINGEMKLSDFKNNEIRLNPNERNLELFFSVFDPLNKDRIRYKFRYKGRSEFWNYLPDGQNSVYLPGLTTGTYKIEIKATDKNGYWGQNSVVVSVRCLPAWYETAWAYTLYILLIISIVYFLLYKYIRYQKEKQHIRMQEELAQIKYRFFTNVSHELRTPLTLIITPLETIMRKITNREIREQLHLIMNNAHSLLELVNQLLDFRKIEMRGEVLSLSVGDLNLFLTSVFENFRLVAEEKNISFRFYAEEDAYEMAYDPDKIRKVVNNLLSNAIKFTEAGGEVTLTLKTEFIAERKYVRIGVQDSGKGIPEEHLPHIFERFRQVRAGHNSLGSGIGLHLVKEYTTMHQGKIQVESAIGKGSQFYISLPVDLPLNLSSTQPEKNPEEEPVPTHAPDKSKKILIVEDNAEFRNYLRKELARYYTVYEAPDGKSGEKQVLDKEPDVVITDLMMPGMDGIELCHRIKNNIRVSHIPVILLTANTSIENEKRGYKEGADAYISKPFSWEIVLSRIENLMEQRLQRQKVFQAALEVNPENITISSLDEEFIKKALACIEENMQNTGYTIEELSRDMAMSRVNLYRKIRSITGTSPSEFVNNIRLKRAAELLIEGRLTVVEVAYRAGFNTPSYFTKSFKKAFGVLPTQYQQNKPK